MNIKDIKFLDKAKNEKTLNDYEGKLFLLVNTASKCGLTPQFDGLEKLHKDYNEQGLVVLGFPCGQFANQELDTAEKAAEFCKLNFGVTFPILDKIDVNGSNTAPIFAEMKKQKGGLFSSKIKWNFAKFLVDENGKVIKRYAPTFKPEKIEKDIKTYLNK